MALPHERIYGPAVNMETFEEIECGARVSAQFIPAVSPLLQLGASAINLIAGTFGIIGNAAGSAVGGIFSIPQFIGDVLAFIFRSGGGSSGGGFNFFGLLPGGR